jgi:hypothetical protein
MISNLENLTDLFDEFYIVQETVLQPVKEKENTPKVNLDGKEQAELLFVFSARLQGVDAEMIHKLIHNAMKLNRETVSFMYLSDNQNLSFDELIKITPIKRVLVWGADQWVDNRLSPYQTQALQGVSGLAVDIPSAYHENIELKTKLWNAIQQLMKA